MVIGHGCRRWWTAIALALQVIAARPVHAQCDATVLCPADPCTITGLHDLGGNCILAFTGKTVTVDGAATLRTDDLGSLTIEAKNLTLAGTITGKGGSVRLDIDNDFSMPVLGSLIDTQSANPGEWGDVDITAGNVATLRRIFTDGVDYGGDIWVEAKSMSVVGPLRANGRLEGGFIRLDAIRDANGVGGDVTITGDVTANATGTTTADGGEIDVIPDGNVSLASTGSLRVNGVSGGAGGLLFISPLGDATIDGLLSADGPGPDGFGGTIAVDARAVTTSSRWSADGGGGAGASGGDISAFALPNDIFASGAVTMSANATNGGRGGTIDFESPGNVTLNGTFTATAGGPASLGGEVSAQAGTTKTLAVGGTLDVRSTTAGGTADGRTFLSACTVTISGTVRAFLSPHTQGRNEVTYHKTLTVSSGAQMLAGAAGGNVANCPCAGLDPLTGTCATTTCAMPPVTAGATITPALSTKAAALAPCTGCPNGIVDAGEECDDGNYVRTDGCHNCRVCGDNNVDAASGEQCDDGNRNDGDCCSRGCLFEASGSQCKVKEDGNPCTDEVCNGSGTCQHPFNTGPCDDGLVCTLTSSCSGGKCVGPAGGCGVVVLLDTSFSMLDRHDGTWTTKDAERKITKAKEAASAFVAMLDKFGRGVSRLGVMTFPDQGNSWGCAYSVVQPMTTVSGASGPQAAIGGLTALGNTPLTTGVDKAVSQFSSEVSRALVLLSDGYQNCPSKVTTQDKEVVDLIGKLKASSIRLFAVGFGQPGDIDVQLLKTLTASTTPANYSGSQFYQVTEPDLSVWNPATALQETYKAILTSVLDLDNVVDPREDISAGMLTTHVVPLTEHDRKVSFYLSWDTPQKGRLALRVRSSNGEPVTASNWGTDLDEGDTYTMLTVNECLLHRGGRVGVTPWQVDIDATGLPPGQDETYQYSVVVDSGIKMRATVQPSTPYAGHPITLSATVTKQGLPVSGLTDVSVLLTRPKDGIGNWLSHAVTPAQLAQAARLRPHAEAASPVSVRARALREVVHLAPPGRTPGETIPLFDDATHGDAVADDGTYTNQLLDATKEGMYSLYFAATGSAESGAPYRRERYLQAHVAVAPASPFSKIRVTQVGALRGQYEVTITPRDAFGNLVGPGHADALALSVSRGELVESLVDAGDGTYRQRLMLPPGGSVKDVRVEVRRREPVAASASAR